MAKELDIENLFFVSHQTFNRIPLQEGQEFFAHGFFNQITLDLPAVEHRITRSNLISKRQKGEQAMSDTNWNRRGVLATGVGVATLLGAPAVLAQATEPKRRNVSGLIMHNWQEHFDDLGKGIIISDTNTRVLQHWNSQGEMRVYPTSVPLTDELTRRGYTSITYKDEAPDWSPTPSMLERDPDLPRYVGPGPQNPLGVRAMHLTWQYYRIHGTNDVRKIGRRSSNGCIGLFNEQIVELYGRTTVGTQVKLI